MTERLTGAVALVTGAARADGIGQGIVRALLADGASLMFSDIEEASGWDTAQTLAAEFGNDRVRFMRQDVTSPEDWQAALQNTLDSFGRLDILVNNAGVSLPGAIETTSLEELRRGMAVNFDSQFLGIKTCAPTLARFAPDRSGGAAIVNNSSMAAYLVDPSSMPYHVSKAAVRMLTMCAAREFGPRKVRVNSVHYGPTLTAPMQRALERYVEGGQYSSVEVALAGIEALSPLGITGTIADAGALVAFLVSDEARFITGAAYWQDGGCFMQY
jgi:3alpha(or 20beta)-hydroxysteroid dehydrogenase/cyclopentanol dehydrogenase